MAADHDAAQRLTAAADASAGLRTAPNDLLLLAAWRADAEVLTHRWEEDVVVFVRRSGATHWLSAGQAVVLDRLLCAADHPRTTAQLASALELNGGDEIADLCECLTQLESISLVVRDSAAVPAR